MPKISEQIAVHLSKDQLLARRADHTWPVHRGIKLDEPVEAVGSVCYPHQQFGLE